MSSFYNYYGTYGTFGDYFSNFTVKFEYKQSILMQNE